MYPNVLYTKFNEQKDNLISLCFESYSDRTHNLFQIIKYNSSNSLMYLWEIVKAYIANLFKAKCVFWLDLDKHYQYIGTAIQDIWLKELDSAIQICQDEGYIIPDLNISMFLESFTQLLYHARMLNLSLRCCIILLILCLKEL